MLRRDFLFLSAIAAARPILCRAGTVSHKDRVDRALAGKEVDCPPFSFWHHFGLKTAEEHAARTLEFHRAYRTDLVKVMSDFPYPKAAGKWYDLKVVQNPFPDQIRALELIHEGLKGSAYMIETVFNSWNVAQKLSSKEELLRLKEERPQALLDALDVITQSQIEHVRRARKAGADGILYSIANANRQEMPRADYEKFSRPFDRRFMQAISDMRLNILHLHVEPTYLNQFTSFTAPIINYSLHVSGIPIAEVRKQFPSWVIAGGLDEVNYRKLSVDELKREWNAAFKAAGPKYILTPGCSVPNDSAPEELRRLPDLLRA